MIGKAIMFALAIGLVPVAADACRCREPSLADAFSHSQAVIVGRVAQVRDVDQMRTVIGIEVERSWKTAPRSRIEVDTGTTCRIPAMVGQRYLMFLRKDGSGRYYSNRCMGDRLDPSADMLQTLDHAPQQRREPHRPQVLIDRAGP